MTRTKSIPTQFRTCMEWPCSWTIPADSDEMRCPLHAEKHAARMMPPQLTNGVEADLVIVGSWMKILTPRGLTWAQGYGSDLPSGCDLLSVFRISEPVGDAERARKAGLVVVVGTR